MILMIYFRNVLNSILNPNLPLGEGVFDPEEKVPERNEEKLLEDDKVKELDKEAVKAAESGDLDKALRLFDEVVVLSPARPASFNNRAQVKHIFEWTRVNILDWPSVFACWAERRPRSGTWTPR